MFTTRVGFIEEKRWAPRPTKDLPESGEWMMHCMFRLRSQEFKKQTEEEKTKTPPDSPIQRTPWWLPERRWLGDGEVGKGDRECADPDGHRAADGSVELPCCTPELILHRVLATLA